MNINIILIHMSNHLADPPTPCVITYNNWIGILKSFKFYKISNLF